MTASPQGSRSPFPRSLSPLRSGSPSPSGGGPGWGVTTHHPGPFCRFGGKEVRLDTKCQTDRRLLAPKGRPEHSRGCNPRMNAPTSGSPERGETTRRGPAFRFCSPLRGCGEFGTRSVGYTHGYALLAPSGLTAFERGETTLRELEIIFGSRLHDSREAGPRSAGRGHYYTGLAPSGLPAPEGGAEQSPGSMTLGKDVHNPEPCKGSSSGGPA